MRILLQPSVPNVGGRDPGDIVREALDVLQTAFVKTEGGGTVASNGATIGVIVISSNDDVPKALAALAQAGIKASIG